MHVRTNAAERPAPNVSNCKGACEGMAQERSPSGACFLSRSQILQSLLEADFENEDLESPTKGRWEQPRHFDSSSCALWQLLSDLYLL